MSDARPTRVLVADDDYMVAQRLVGQLLSAGYEVLGTARDGLEAVEMAVALRPDVAILDLDMPVQGGVKAAKQIREERPMPIVIVTAYHSPSLIKECSEAGAGAYLVKPVEGPELVRAIEVARTRFNELSELNRYRNHLEQLVAARTEELASANESLRASLQAKDTLLANMSHELRTPLNAILGLSEALQEEVYGPLAPKQRQSLETIEGSGKRLLSLINGVLDLSRLEARQLHLQISKLDVDALCTEVILQVRARAEEQGHKLELGIDKVIGTIDADRTRLRQILLILLDNAMKFTDSGGEVGLEVARRNDETVSFAVWDTGPGVPPETLSTLTQPFTQASKGLARKYEGAGLGLALAARLLGLHGGRLELSSEPGHGSRFTALLPIKARGQVA